MKEAKLRMEDALNATRAAVEEGIIAGGGSAYIHASKEVAKLAETLEGDEKTGAKVVLKALEAPLFHISANAGLEGAVIINKVREAEPGNGFDAYNEEYVEMCIRDRLYIYEKCPHDELTIIMRRYMMRIAEHFAKEGGCLGPVSYTHLPRR